MGWDYVLLGYRQKKPLGVIDNDMKRHTLEMILTWPWKPNLRKPKGPIFVGQL